MPAATEMQQMEMDMVQGMYDSYKLLSEDPPQYSVDLAASMEDPPELRVTITYSTEDYPESAPCAVAVENVSKKRRIPTGNLTKELTAACENNVGAHSVILLLQQAQEYLSNFAEEEEKADLVRRGEALNAAASTNLIEDPTIRIGTAVTKDLFAEWSRKRLLEKSRARADRERQEKKDVGSKLTGRQLWDSTLKTADWELFGGDGGVEEDAEDVDFDALRELDEGEYDLED